jgi:hypothetical protein
MSKSVVERVNELMFELGVDECKVLEALAKRLLEGQLSYGKLDLKHDPRDWRKERSMEVQDLLIYSAFLELKESLK